MVANKNLSLDELLLKASNLVEVQKEQINWAKGLGFLDKKPNSTSVDFNAVELAKTFTETDNLARIVWDNEFKIIFANNNFLKVLGYGLSDVVGHYIIEPNGTSRFITKETLPKSISKVQTNMRSGVKMLEGIENEWIAKDGSLVSVKWLIGFNDTKNKIGSTQCLFLSQ